MVLNYSIPNKLINKDKKQLAVFVSQHFSQQFFAHFLPIIRALYAFLG